MREHPDPSPPRGDRDEQDEVYPGAVALDAASDRMMSADTRLFIKVHNGLPEHPKVAGLSDGAFRALVELWCYCSRNLTDGHVPSAILRRTVADVVVDELLESGMADPTDAGIYMHDYLEHQQSRSEVEALKEKRVDAGRRGGQASAQARAQASASAPAQASAQAKSNGGASKTQADIDTDLDTDLGEPLRGSPSRARRAKPLPDDWAPHDLHREQARAKGVDADAEAETFRNHAQSVDRRLVDWDAGFRNWLAKARPDNNGAPTDRQALILRAEMQRAQAADAARERTAHLFPQIGAR